MSGRRKLSATTLVTAIFVFVVSTMCAAQSGNQGTAMTVNGLAVINGGPVWTTGGLNGEATGQHLTLGFDTTNNIGYMGATNNGTGFSDFRLRGSLISFWTGTTELAERLTMTADGNLGIGTTTPLERLHINLGNFRIDGTPGTHGIIFPDGTKQFTAAISGVTITSPDNSILVGGTSVAPTLALNTSFTDARYASLADIALLNAQIAALNAQVANLKAQVSELHSAVFPPGQYAVARHYSGGVVQAVAVDRNGNYAITGYFGQTINFGCGSMTSSAPNDAYVAKFSPNGTCIWAKHLGAAGSSTYGKSIAIDTNGNVVIGGYFSGAVDFGGGQVTSSGNDAFLVQFSADGTYQWAKKIGGNGSDQIRSIAVDATGSIFVAGNHRGVDFGGGLLTVVGNNDMFISKFSSDGDYIWAKSFGSSGDDSGEALAVDATGDVVVAGYFNGTITVGTVQLTSTIQNDYAIFKLSAADGSVNWARSYHGSQLKAIAVDSSNNIVVTGNISGTVDFGITQLSSAGLADILIAKLAPVDGSAIWARRFGNTYPDDGYGIATDADGNIVITGKFFFGVDFGGGTMTSHGGSLQIPDVFVAKYSPDGLHCWSRNYGDTTYDATGKAVAILPNGNVLAVGEFRGTVDFGAGPFTAPGSANGKSDIFTLVLQK